MNMPIGLGCSSFKIAVCIENRPSFSNCSTLDHLQALQPGEIYAISQQCGNGWRKVFNVYAKLIEQLKPNLFDYPHSRWQDYRDHDLLQQGSKTALLFSSPPIKALSSHDFSTISKRDDTGQDLTKLSLAQPFYVISGRSYARKLYENIERGNTPSPLQWLDEEFAIDKKNRTIVCPYFDYRQLSNIKIDRLARELLKRYQPD